MNAEEKLLFKERYDEIGHDGMELEACYELIKEMPIDADELLDELEEWESYNGIELLGFCHYVDYPIGYYIWNDFLDDISELIENNIESFTEFVEKNYKEIQIDEALEDEDIIEHFLYTSIIYEEIKIKENIKELQEEFSEFLLESYADSYFQTDNYLCIKAFPYDVSM